MSADRILSSLVLCACLFLPAGAVAQGYAGLGTDAGAGFSVPERGRALVFPGDHGPHPDYRIEWWYLTANLVGEDGRDYGLQWTLFRAAGAPGEAEGWDSPQVWIGHAGVTTAESHFAAERFARGGVGQAGVEATPFAAWIDEWRMEWPFTEGPVGDSANGTQDGAGPGDGAEGGDALSSLHVSASGTDFAYSIRLQADGPLVLQGDAGYSVKSEAGQASYYYSQPFYRAEGRVTLPEGEIAVSGQAWLDREWSSQPLAPDQSGWDWFSLHFEGGEKLMGFRLRDAGEGFTSATWIEADGSAHPMPPGALRLTPGPAVLADGREIPVVWEVELPEHGLAVTATALNPLSWMDLAFPYWEGPVQVEGTHRGRGYLEMTGY